MIFVADDTWMAGVHGTRIQHCAKVLDTGKEMLWREDDNKSNELKSFYLEIYYNLQETVITVYNRKQVEVVI